MPALMAALRAGGNRSIACNAGKLMQRMDVTNGAWCRALANSKLCRYCWQSCDSTYCQQRLAQCRPVARNNMTCTFAHCAQR